MNHHQVKVIFDALEYKEDRFLERLEREPRTRGGKPNPMVRALQKELDDIADAKIAFRYAKIEMSR